MALMAGASPARARACSRSNTSSKLNFTSAELNGCPSCQRTPGTRRKVTVRPSAEMSQLRARLLLGILLPLAAILALGAWGLYRNALASAQAAFDRQLVSAAHAIADTLRLEGQRMSVSVPYAVLELHAPEPGGVFFHRVTGLEGELLSGDETLPRYRGPVPSAAGYTGLVGLYDDQVRETPVRVAVVYQPVDCLLYTSRCV